MRVIIKHIAKNIIEKKMRTLLILATIILSTMVLFIGLSLNDILNNTYSTMTKGAYGDANILLTKASNEEGPFYRAENIKLDSTVIHNRVDLVQAVGTSKLKGKDVRVSLTGLELENAIKMGIVLPINQAENYMLNDDQVIISTRTASNYDLDVGDYFEVVIDNLTYEYRIGAISKPIGLYYSEMDDIILVGSRNQINEIHETDDSVTSTLFKVENENLDTSISVLTNNNTSFFVQKTSQLQSNTRDEETFQTTVVMAIIIIVMISAYVILSLSKVIVAERMPTVGTFRSVGSTKRMINRVLRMEFLFYGIIGAGIGLLLGFLLLPIAADSFNEYKEYGLETIVQYHPFYLIIAFVFGAIFPVSVGMIHIYRANKTPLKEIILNTTQTVKEQSKMAMIMGMILFASSIVIHIINKQDKLMLAVASVLFIFIAIVLLMPIFLNVISQLATILLAKLPRGEVKLGIKNISNNKLVSNNASMIIVVFLLLLMVGVTSAGIDEYVKKVVKQDFDVFIGDHEMDFSKYEDIETIEGISEVYKQHISAGQYDINGAQDTFIVYGVEDIDEFDQFYSGAIFFDDSKSNFSNVDNGIIIDNYQAERYGLEVGDTILLEPVDKDFQPIQEREFLELELTGTMDSVSLMTNRDIVIVPLNYFKNHFISNFDQIEVKVNKGVDAEIVKNSLENHYQYSGIEVQTFKKLIESQKATVDTLIKGVLIIVFLGLVIGLLGISNNLLVSFIERKKEYAILYSVCMSRVQLVKMLSFEMIMTFASVVVIGIVGGFMMNLVWSRLLYAVGLKIDFSFNYELFFILCGAVFALLALSSLYIIRKVARLNVLDELRYE